MNLYHVDRNKMFNGQITVANKNPKYQEKTHDIADKYIYNPASSSLVSPPSCGDNEACLLNNGAWKIVINRLGQHYYTQDGEKHFIDGIGEDLPEGSIVTVPPSIYHDTHDGLSWIENTVKRDEEEVEGARLADIKIEKESSSLRKITINQANAFIDNKVKGDLQAQIDGLKLIIKKLVVFIL